MKAPLVILSSCLLASCGDQLASNPSITGGRYAALANEKARTPAAYRLGIEIEEKGKGTVYRSTARLKPGARAEIEQIREFIYPTEFRLAETAAVKVPASGNPAAITPVTPTGFSKKHTGYTGELELRQEGAFVVVSGMLRHVAFTGFTRAPGEAVSPLVDARSGRLISENTVQMPNFRSTETPVYVAGLAGKTHVFDLPDIPAKLKITCEPAD